MDVYAFWALAASQPQTGSYNILITKVDSVDIKLTIKLW